MRERSRKNKVETGRKVKSGNEMRIEISTHGRDMSSQSKCSVHVVICDCGPRRALARSLLETKAFETAPTIMYLMHFGKDHSTRKFILG